MMESFLGATGGLGSGTPIAQSVAYTNTVFSGPSFGTFDNSFIVPIPSGTNISTWVRYTPYIGISTGAISMFWIGVTGTHISVQQIG